MQPVSRGPHNPLRRPTPKGSTNAETPAPRSGDPSEGPVLLREPCVSTQTLPSVVVQPPGEVGHVGLVALPTLIASAGERAARRFLEFFTATIRNKNTRLAYA